MSHTEANSTVTMLTSMIQQMWTETSVAQFEALSWDLHDGTEQSNKN
jgi:hypothetical protein